MILSSYLSLGAILFSIGLFGVLTKRNPIIVLISIELMLNAANLNLVAFSRWGVSANATGQIFSLFSITVAAAEVAVGLAIVIALFRNRHVREVDRINKLKG
ncbi:NADH-quinone oxidoreductase subunit NuoK [Mechercharimyces sp. CAU 1602]|uniref:NADH-quinone oxidoreductase subunit NuoK n=1 Tax=Mechercharimyces sp. CAU 1602 TaxID=2973933 RepID=UPI002162E6BC|nr:NADH-quinone oxidoreductase subunit NuoK [Mechercharimyces sp. CAU 1602]MCS1352270.1 NADH-quinone oxidoreductase subunit NuoK [Mechercharimyces sp. CAU 1602]